MSVSPLASSFSPAANNRAYRKALGRFTTGIAVVTAMTKDGPIGITVNSFASLSLEPALVMWAPAKGSFRHDAFASADHYAVHVLSGDQRAVCDSFVKDMRAFNEIAVVENEFSVPIIQGCLAVFECKRSALHDAGDHTIIVGEVVRVSEREGDALIFQNGVIGVTSRQTL